MPSTPVRNRFANRQHSIDRVQGTYALRPVIDTLHGSYWMGNSRERTPDGDVDP